MIPEVLRRPSCRDAGTGMLEPECRSAGNQRFRSSRSTVTEWALSREHDVALMRALGASTFPGAIHGSSEEVCAGIDARCVDVVVLGEVAHVELMVQDG